MREIEFINLRGRFAIVSVVLVLASLGYLIGPGIKRSVDFEGGTKLTVDFVEKLAIGEVREAVDAVEPGAAIVALEVDSGSEFTIKIKRAEDADSADGSGLGLERQTRLESAFASLGDDDAQILSLIGSLSEQDLAQRLNASNLLNVQGTDQERQVAHASLATTIKSSIEGATSLLDLAEKAQPDNPVELAVGLKITFPAINRVTADLLGQILVRDDPLARGIGSSYDDVVSAITDARRSAGDFLPDLDAAAAAVSGEDGTVLGEYLKSHFITGSYKIVANESFSASIAAELLANAWTAVILALLGILIYIALRFQWGYAVASVVALAHDVIISLGFFAVMGGELSNPVVAAFLTIVGYSLNDTIVVFDRIRDNINATKRPDMPRLMNQSINQTLSRTIVTSLTTFFVVGVIYFFSGNETLRDFSLPLIIGIIVGTYSSIFVASPTLLLWHSKVKHVNV